MFVKICGITVPEDLQAAADAGADAVGLNLVPTSSRYLTLEQAAALLEACPASLQAWGVFQNASLDFLLDFLNRMPRRLDRIQLHGTEPDALADALRQANWPLTRTAHVNTASGQLTVPAVTQDDILLIDSSVQGQQGGTGVPFDWELARPFVQTHNVLLAGGLHPENVADAVKQIQPWGVDTASGVCRAGDPRRKDHKRIREFVMNAKTAGM